MLDHIGGWSDLTATDWVAAPSGLWTIWAELPVRCGTINMLASNISCTCLCFLVFFQISYSFLILFLLSTLNLQASISGKEVSSTAFRIASCPASLNNAQTSMKQHKALQNLPTSQKHFIYIANFYHSLCSARSNATIATQSEIDASRTPGHPCTPWPLLFVVFCLYFFSYHSSGVCRDVSSLIRILLTCLLVKVRPDQLHVYSCRLSIVTAIVIGLTPRGPLVALVRWHLQRWPQYPCSVLVLLRCMVPTEASIETWCLEIFIKVRWILGLMQGQSDGPLRTR